MLSKLRRRFAVLLMQIVAVFLGLVSAAVLLTGLLVAVAFAVAVALLIMIYLALSRRRRRGWQF